MKQLFDYSDVGVGLRHQLPKACVLQKVVDMSPDKNISVHFVFTRPSNTSEFEARDGYIICSMIKFDTSGSCKILVSHHVPTVARRNAYACQIEPNAGHGQCAFTIHMTRWRFNTNVLQLKLFEQKFPSLRLKPDGTTGTKL